MDDESIIRLFNLRSEQAIMELDKKYGKLCKSISYNILHNEEDVLECINDSYFGIWNKIPPEHPNPLVAFVCRIVRNISLTRYKYNNSKKRNGTYDICLEELAGCISAYNNVEKEYDTALLAQFIDNFIDTLDFTNKIIFIRRYWFLDDYVKLSSQLGLSEGAIRVRLVRIRKKLILYLEKEGVIL